MLNISGIHEGFVLDHIKAGESMQIYHDLKLDQFDGTVAIIMNVESKKMGTKDIIKVECPIDAIDLDILGYIDHNITVNVIQHDEIVDKVHQVERLNIRMNDAQNSTAKRAIERAIEAAQSELSAMIDCLYGVEGMWGADTDEID